jgi:hypothetical protein
MPEGTPLDVVEGVHPLAVDEGSLIEALGPFSQLVEIVELTRSPRWVCEW